MPMDFPSSPTIGQQSNGYVWTGTAWDSTSAQPITLNTNAPGYNYIINGGMDIWQRGTSFTGTNNVYLADRWFGNGGNVTVSRQTTGAPASSTAYMRTAMTSTTFNNKTQFIESANVDPLHGKNVTLQAKVRRNSTFTGGLQLMIQKSVTVDAGFGATWVSVGSVNIPNSSLPTGTGSPDWFTQTLTVAVPNDGTANSLRVEINQTTVEVSGAYWDMAEVQLEVGEAATAFRRNAPSIQAELAACQRYYQVIASGENSFFATGHGFSTVSVFATYTFPVQLRTSGGVATISSVAHFRTYSANGSGIVFTAFSVESVTPQNMRINGTVAAGLTVGQAAILSTQNSSAFFAISAEL